MTVTRRKKLFNVIVGFTMSTVMAFGLSATYFPDELKISSLTPAYADGKNEILIFENGLRYKVVDESYAVIVGFDGNDDVSSVVIPQKIEEYDVKIIKEGTFARKYNLTEISIPDGVVTIEEAAFASCNIENLYIPASVSYIGDGAFGGCSNLKSITVDENNDFYDSRNDCNAIVEKKTDTLICGCINTVIDSSVTCIGNCAFFGCPGLKNISLRDGIKKIGFLAFAECDGLEWVEVPVSVNEIDYEAFGGNSDDFFVKCHEDSKIIDYVKENGLRVQILKHAYKDVITKAKPSSNGKIVKICSECEKKGTITTIYAPKEIVLKTSSFVYNAKAKKPAVTVKDNNGKVIDAKNYSVTYSNNINVATADKKPTVKVTFKGDRYQGTLSKTFTIKKANNKLTVTTSYTKTASGKAQSFKINAKATGGKLTYKSNNSKVKVDSTGKVTIAKNYSDKAVITVTAGDNNYKSVSKNINILVKPAATTLKNVKNTTPKNASKGRRTVTWNKLSYVTGYQLQYSTTSNFKSGTNKLLTVKGASNVSRTLTGLVKGKKYYVRIRTYKTIAGKNVFSAWSAKK